MLGLRGGTELTRMGAVKSDHPSKATTVEIDQSGGRQNWPEGREIEHGEENPTVDNPTLKKSTFKKPGSRNPCSRKPMFKKPTFRSLRAVDLCNNAISFSFAGFYWLINFGIHREAISTMGSSTTTELQPIQKFHLLAITTMEGVYDCRTLFASSLIFPRYPRLKFLTTCIQLLYPQRSIPP